MFLYPNIITGHRSITEELSSDNNYWTLSLRKTGDVEVNN